MHEGSQPGRFFAHGPTATHPASAMTNDKNALRARLRAVRRSLSDDARAAAHRTMAAQLLCLVETLPPGGVIALYASAPDEADPRGLLVVLPAAKVAWPRVVGPELELAVCKEADLVPGFRGILEPPAHIEPIGVSQVRLIVVPGLGFDRHGYRLGQGGGHYDRLLARLRATAHPGLVVGLAYASQIVADVPREAHDQGVDLIVTEQGLVHDP